MLLVNIMVGMDYYVSTTGNDEGTGTINFPFKTINKLLFVIEPGDTGFIRGGTYPLNYTTQHSGTEVEPIVIKAYENEHTVLVGKGRISDGGRFRIKHSWYIIENLELKNASAGFTITSYGTHNIIRNCSVHYHYYTGIYLTNGAAYNQIIDCDAYDMYDTRTDGGSGDGYSISGQSYTPGPGNKFIGCRAWHNSDDGFDVWKASYPVEFINCYAFKNGTHSGDGNGFKLGINKTDRDKHILKNCAAWNNRQNGFDYNENPLSQTLYNCTAYNNGRNYKFGDLRGGPVTDEIENCISVKTSSSDILLQTVRDNNTNSWNFIRPNEVNIVEDNFSSTNDFIISGSRNADGSIPESDFLRLKKGSLFIDSGVDVGLPFNGDTPDLGAFESELALDVKKTNIHSKNSIKLSSYPNPANGYAVVSYVLPASDYMGELMIYNILGEKVKSFVINNKYGNINISTQNLPCGTYIYVIKTATHVSNAKKILIVK